MDEQENPAVVQASHMAVTNRSGMPSNSPFLPRLSPMFDPNARPRFERNRFEHFHQIGDVFANGRFSSEFAGTCAVTSLDVVRRRGNNAIHFCLKLFQYFDGITTEDMEGFA
jgi:hypothetical protein